MQMSDSLSLNQTNRKVQKKSKTARSDERISTGREFHVGGLKV